MLSGRPSAEPEAISLPLVWIDLDSTDIDFVNMILVQQGEGSEFFLAFGQVAPPLVTSDDPAVNREALKAIPYLPVHTVARMGTTFERLEQFTQLMERVLTRAREQRVKAQGTTRAERRRR